MRHILLALILFFSCTLTNAQEVTIKTANADSWSDFVIETIKYLKTTDDSRVVANNDVTIFRSGTPWSFEMDPSKRLYSIAILYLPRFAPAPTVSFSFKDGVTVKEDKDFAKAEDETYGAKVVNVKPDGHNLGRLTMKYNGGSESSSVRVIVIEH